MTPAIPETPTKLSQRLRDAVQGYGKADYSLTREAADTLDAQAARIDALTAALDVTHDALMPCYDSSEDNRNNPTMQRIGKALERARAALAASEGKAP